MKESQCSRQDETGYLLNITGQLEWYTTFLAEYNIITQKNEYIKSYTKSQKSCLQWQQCEAM